jgi:hypothetical protein
MLRTGARTLLAVLLAASCGAPGAGRAGRAPALPRRPAQVTRALDFLHAHQDSDGRFQDPAYTPWAVIAIAAAGEDPDGSAWTMSGRSPMDYLQSLDLDAHATQGTVGNAPAYYAKMILAYAAAGHREHITAAGSRRISLVSRLLSYQRSDGRFCPSASSDYVGAVNTSTWAIIALRAAGAGSSAQADAVAWLRTEQLSGGGFASMAKDGPGTPISDVDDTAAAIEALIAGGVAPGSGVVSDARSYLKSAQRSDGGFSADKNGGFTYAESTAWALQAIIALSENPGGAAWKNSGGSAVDALRRLQASNGAFLHRSSTMATPLLTTPQSIVALAGRTFATFPRDGSAWVAPFAWSPRVTAMTPADGANISSTTVTVRATYRDGAGGTGIAKSGVRLTVDGRDVTKLARVSASSLIVTLTATTAGQHRIAIRIRDRSGNARILTHTVTIGSGSGSGSTGPAAESSTAAATDVTGGTVAGAGSGAASSGSTKASEAASTTAAVPFPAASASVACPGPAASPGASSNALGSATGVTAATRRDEAASATSTPLLVAIAVVPTAIGVWLTRRSYRRWRHTADGPPPGTRSAPAAHASRSHCVMGRNAHRGPQP